MLEPVVLATGTGVWITLGLIGAFAVVGLAALARTRAPRQDTDDRVRYVFGLGKHPRLLELPDARDLPATPEPLGGDGLRDLAADADSKTAFTVTRYRLPDGRTAPYELSDGLPDDITEVELELEDVRVVVDDEGEIAASRRLTGDELEELGGLLDAQFEGEPPRADRRTWSPPDHEPEDANAHRV
jgi:hypothetical protein